MSVTRKLRASKIAASEAAAIPLPKEETTPPVVNIYFVIASPSHFALVRNTQIMPHFHLLGF